MARARPSSQALKGEGTEKAAHDIAVRLTPSMEQVGVLLPRGSLDDIANFAKARVSKQSVWNHLRRCPRKPRGRTSRTGSMPSGSGTRRSATRLRIRNSTQISAAGFDPLQQCARRQSEREVFLPSLRSNQLQSAVPDGRREAGDQTELRRPTGESAGGPAEIPADQGAAGRSAHPDGREGWEVAPRARRSGGGPRQCRGDRHGQGRAERRRDPHRDRRRGTDELRRHAARADRVVEAKVSKKVIQKIQTVATRQRKP